MKNKITIFTLIILLILSMSFCFCQNNKINTQQVSINNLENKITLKTKIIDDPKFLRTLFPEINIEKIYFGNLNISGNNVNIQDSLFICIDKIDSFINVNEDAKNITMIGCWFETNMIEGE